MLTQGNGGYTLIEILIAIAIAAVFTQLSISGLQALIDKSQATGALQTAIAALDHARSLAVIRRENTGVCIIEADASCSTEWNGNELAVFIDANKNWQHDKNEEIIYEQPLSNGRLQLRWGKNWRKKPIISYQPDGSVTSNGTLTLQKTTGENIAAIVISKAGRARIETGDNHD